MQSRFVVPVIVATAFHALVFFGFPSGSADPVAPTPPGPVLPPLPRITYDLDLETPPLPSSDEPKQPKGTPEYRPIQDETIVNTPVDWAIPPGPAPRVPVDITPMIPIGPIGDPDGDENAEWKENVVINVKFLDNTPRARVQVAPVYPHEAKSAGLTGEVVVDFVVDENGRVIQARVVKSSNSIFDAPTLRAVGKWRFEPGLKTGRPVRFRMIAPVVFNLEA